MASQIAPFRIITNTILPQVDAAYDIGSPTFRIRDLYLSGNVTPSGNIQLGNNTFLQGRDAADLNWLNLLKVDATDDTVLNASTGNLIKLQVNEVSILELSSTDLVYTPPTFQIRAASSDGTDDQLLILAGGGLGGPGQEIRGAYINIAGNEQALAGQIQLIAGNTGVGSGAGDIDIHCTGPIGEVTFFTQDLARLAVTSGGDLKGNVTNGGNFVIQRPNFGYQQGTDGSPHASILSAFGTYPGFLQINDPTAHNAIATGAYGANASGPSISGFKTRSAATNAPATTIVAAGDNLLIVSAYGADGVDYKISSSIAFQASGTPAVNSIPGDILLNVVKTGASSQTQLVRAFSSGNFAITSETSLNADVNAAWGQSPFLIIANNNTADAFINIGNGNNAVGAHSHSAKTRSTGTDANTIVVNGDELSAQTTYGADGVTYRAATKIASFSDGAPGVAVMPGRLEFHTAVTNGVLRRWYIDSGGRFNQDATNGGDFVFNSATGVIRQGTADAADTGAITLNGGGANGSSRGSSVEVYGNENAATGQLQLRAGNVSGGLIGFNTGGTQRVAILNGGTTSFGTAGTLDSDVSGAFGTIPFLITNNNNTQDALINLGNGNNTVGAHFFGVKTRSSGSDANTIVVTEDELAQFAGYGADGVVYRAAARIQIKVEGAPASNVMPGRIEFLTTLTSGANRRFYIDSVGDFYSDATTGGNFIFDRVAKTISLKQTTNGKAGTVVLNGATAVAVGNTSITAGSTILFTLKTVGGTVGAVPAVQTITPGNGFTVAGTALDTSTYNYSIIETA